jgi:GTP cyclohydrolase III
MYLDIEEHIENNFTKTDQILQFAKGGKNLITACNNSRSKPWHDIITNSRDKKLEEYLTSRQVI